MGTEAVWIPLVMAAVGAGASAYNTNQTMKKQDDAAAAGILNQSRLQREADSKVDKTVQELSGSTAADERAARLQDYMGQLMRTRQQSDGDPNAALIGGEAFKTSNAASLAKQDAAAAQTAKLMSVIDGASLQRQGEGNTYGQLATDIGLVGRQSRGQQFIDQLRAQQIRRNPWIDIGAGALTSGAGAMAGGGGAAPAAGANTGKQFFEYGGLGALGY